MEVNHETQEENPNIIDGIPQKGKTWNVGETYKITGGKYKKFGTAVLKRLNATYSDCELPADKCEELSQINREVKIKNDYLLADPTPVIDMPDVDDLKVVDNLEEHFKQCPADAKKFKEQVQALLEEPDPEGTLEMDKEGNIVDNITDCCPSIQEALDLRNEVLKLRKEVIAQKEELILKDKQIKLECEKQVVLNSRLDLIRGGFANIGVLLNQGLN